jgi:L,D-transpeptidase ErfK/SrfK
MRTRIAALCGALFLSCLPLQGLVAGQFPLPAANSSIVGTISYSTTTKGETLLSIGQKHNIGVNAMLGANPGGTEITPLAEGTLVKIPTRFLLPPGPRNGIVINLPEMRMYYYPKGSDKLMTFPIGIGKIGRTIPITDTAIARKTVNPTWIPPQSIRDFNHQQGIELPHAMGPGPDNPLGPFAIYLKVPTFLIHSTIYPESIGRRASFGCIRMHETDIKEFFPLVQAGTPVEIIDMPIKVGWAGNKLYLEAHQPLEEHGDGGVTAIVHHLETAKSSNEVTLVNWPAVAYLAEQRDGVPHEIGFKVKTSAANG